MKLTLAVVRYCAEEVCRQGDDALAVADMVEAWCLAMEDFTSSKPLTTGLVKRWAAVVDDVNVGGYRTGGVRVGTSLPPAAHLVAARMNQWALKAPSLTPEEAYRQFEEVHPFWNGNGRTGKIILNYLNRTLENPVWPPNFFGCSNP